MNEDGMIRLPWRDKGPYVVQVSREGETKYLSRAGMEDLGPAFDALDKAATFEVKNDARYFADIARGITEDGQVKVIPQREAEQRQKLSLRSLDQSLDRSLERGGRDDR
jgi:hypothetical protein